MGQANWYRNEHWDQNIEAAFFAKLSRAKRKSQYLRIQACILSNTHPNVALRLLELYFDLDAEFDRAQAFVDRATACLALGDLDSAIKSYEDALATEKLFPNCLTQARFEYPFLIASIGRSDRYHAALDVLNNCTASTSFPIQTFMWNAARSIILAETQHYNEACEFAYKALDAANLRHSGFHYHAALGLVGEKHETVINRLREIVAK